jgi:hypothetical protein
MNAIVDAGTDLGAGLEMPGPDRARAASIA